MKVIYWAGDSTVKQNTIDTYPQTGIGQGLDRYVKRGEVVISNHAENGRSTRSFIDEGRLIPIYDSMRAGDFLFIQFGHNDEKAQDPARFAAADTEYADNLERFVNAARNKGAIPVIITPLCRRLFAGNTPEYRHADWAASARRTAQRLGVACIDLTAASERLVASWGERSMELYMHLPAGVWPNYPQGMTDNTHLTTVGATMFAGLIADGLLELGGEYADLICEEYAAWKRTVGTAAAKAPEGASAPVEEMDEDAAVGYGKERT